MPDLDEQKRRIEEMRKADPAFDRLLRELYRAGLLMQLRDIRVTYHHEVNQ